jgi:hypothetical protein
MSHHHHHHRAQTPFRFSCNTTTITTITDAPPIGLPQHHHPTNEKEDTIPKDNEKPIVVAVVSSTQPLPLPITIFRQGWQSVLQLLQGRQQIAILTGAGMSVSCGIPDFRSQGSGLYATLDTHVRYDCYCCGGYCCGGCCIILVMPVCVCVCSLFWRVPVDSCSLSLLPHSHHVRTPTFHSDEIDYVRPWVYRIQKIYLMHIFFRTIRYHFINLPVRYEIECIYIYLE